MPDSSRPAPHRLTGLAIDVLTQAANDADKAPIVRRPEHRLALAWLAYRGLAKDWQIKAFWHLLGHAGQYQGPQAEYCRTRDFRIWLDAWKRAAGIRL